MSKAADISEPASELEHLMADLAGLGPLVFVFGDDFAVTDPDRRVAIMLARGPIRTTLNA
jgi:hypothetical protein